MKNNNIMGNSKLGILGSTNHVCIVLWINIYPKNYLNG